MCETAAGIFVWPAWGLDDTIKGDMFKHKNFSHDRVPISSHNVQDTCMLERDGASLTARFSGGPAAVTLGIHVIARRGRQLQPVLGKAQAPNPQNDERRP